MAAADLHVCILIIAVGINNPQVACFLLELKNIVFILIEKSFAYGLLMRTTASDS